MINAADPPPPPTEVAALQRGRAHKMKYIAGERCYRRHDRFKFNAIQIMASEDAKNPGFKSNFEYSFHLRDS